MSIHLQSFVLFLNIAERCPYIYSVLKHRKAMSLQYCREHNFLCSEKILIEIVREVHNF